MSSGSESLTEVYLIFIYLSLLPEVPVPEAFQNVALSETLEPSSLSDSLKSDPVLKLKPQPAEVLASTPIVDRLGKGMPLISNIGVLIRLIIS